MPPNIGRSSVDGLGQNTCGVFKSRPSPSQIVVRVRGVILICPSVAFPLPLIETAQSACLSSFIGWVNQV